MQVEGVNRLIITDEPKLLGVHEAKDIYLCFGKYGYYLKYNNKNYSIPEWAKKETFGELMELDFAIKIIDWKIRNQVPRGEAVCKKIDASENECPWYTKDTL